MWGLNCPMRDPNLCLQHHMYYYGRDDSKRHSVFFCFQNIYVFFGTLWFLIFCVGKMVHWYIYVCVCVGEEFELLLALCASPQMLALPYRDSRKGKSEAWKLPTGTPTQGNITWPAGSSKSSCQGGRSKWRSMCTLPRDEEWSSPFPDEGRSVKR